MEHITSEYTLELVCRSIHELQKKTKKKLILKYLQYISAQKWMDTATNERGIPYYKFPSKPTLPPTFFWKTDHKRQGSSQAVDLICSGQLLVEPTQEHGDSRQSVVWRTEDTLPQSVEEAGLICDLAQGIQEVTDSE